MLITKVLPMGVYRVMERVTPKVIGKKLLTQYDRVINLTQYGFYICNSEYADILEIALNLACQQIAYDHIGTAEYFQDYFLKRAKEVTHEKATQEEE